MTKPAKSCTRRTLAMGDVAVVEQCQCGTIHLAIGAVRLQLPPCVIASVADTMQEAVRALAFEEALEAATMRDELAS